MRALLLLAIAACSSATPEPAPTKPKDAAPPTTPPPREPAAGLRQPTPCGTSSGTKPPSPVVQLVAAAESCARLTDGTIWCWGGRGQDFIRSDATGPLACPVATRIDEFGTADALWSMGRDTCATGNGVSRCGVLTDWGFSAEEKLGTRTTFYWNGLPCGITKDARLRCYADQRASELAMFGPVDQAIPTRGGTELCVLSKTAVNCLRSGKVEVLASNVAQLAAGERLWALRNDNTVVRLDSCADGKPCAVPLAGVRDAVSIASAGSTVCALQRDGRVACLRCESKTPCADTATLVDGITDATQIAVGWAHACVLRKNGEVVCWGASNCGQAGGSVEAGKLCPDKPIVLPPTTIHWSK
jgi:hypothetical protein